MLDLEDVTLRIGGRTLLEQASLRLPAGQSTGLVGANGSGKTSLLASFSGGCWIEWRSGRCCLPNPVFLLLDEPTRALATSHVAPDGSVC